MSIFSTTPILKFFQIILLKILSIIIKFKHCLILLLIILSHQNQGDPHLARVGLKLREREYGYDSFIPGAGPDSDKFGGRKILVKIQYP